MPSNQNANPVIQESIRGIQKEIDRRTWYISGLKLKYTGNERTFDKPLTTKQFIVTKALELHRQVLKLKEIKKQMIAML